MKGHLSNDEFTEHLLGAGQSATEEHLASCAECREEAARVARALGAFKVWAREESSKQAAVNVWAVSLSQRKHVPRGVLAWAGTIGMTVITAMLLLVLGNPHVSPPKPAGPNVGHQVQSQQESDDQLLLEVQAALDSNVPRALAPAAMLASERNRVIQETATRNQ